MEQLALEEIRAFVRAALAEDIGTGDATTLSAIPLDAVAEGVMVAREPLVVSGLALAEETFRALAPQASIVSCVRDGHQVPPGEMLLRVRGPARSLLTGERVALNFVQRLSGVATLTARFVQAVSGTGVRILDTRKTTPGLRRLEKYAVRCGGGENHRAGLFDMILIKDNHLAVLKDARPNPIAAAVQAGRRRFPHLKIEVEADTLDQVAMALEAGADMILLDNMSCEQLRAAVTMVRRRIPIEASGGVNLDTVRAIAESGVDFISVGALTHSARAVDIGLDFEM